MVHKLMALRKSHDIVLKMVTKRGKNIFPKDLYATCTCKLKSCVPIFQSSIICTPHFHGSLKPASELLVGICCYQRWN